MSALSNVLAWWANTRFSVNPEPITANIDDLIAVFKGQQTVFHTDLAGSQGLTSAQLYSTVRIDASGGASVVTLPATADDSDWVIVRKRDASANRVTVRNSAAVDQAWLSAQHDQVMFAWWGAGWVPVTWNIAPITDLFVASGTWTKAPLAKFASVVVIGASPGGGSGRRGAAGAARSGGQAGQNGGVSRYTFAAADLSATEVVTIGAGGTGGAAQTVDTTDGNPGTLGGTTGFGTHLQQVSGNVGLGGGAVAIAGGSGVFCLGGTTSFGVGTQITGPSVTPTPSSGPGCGGSGGGITTGNVDQAGATGGTSSQVSPAPLTGGAGGAGGGVNNGGNGTAITDTTNQFGGPGGGGGGGNSTGAGGAGGNGGAPGGGGGGGGAALNGANSGAGGNGARGECRVQTYF